MGRPLNVSEVDWLRAEVKRMKQEGSSGGDRASKLQALLHDLYNLYTQCEEYNADSPTVRDVQRELGLV